MLVRVLAVLAVLAVLDPISIRIFRCLTGTRLKSFGKITRWEAETQAKSMMDVCSCLRFQRNDV